MPVNLKDCPGQRCYGFVQREYLAFSVPLQEKDQNIQIACVVALWLWCVSYYMNVYSDLRKRIYAVIPS